MLLAEEMEALKHIVMADEGVKLFPYVDCCGKEWRKCQCKAKGKLTIGSGRNLDDVGISEKEVLLLLQSDLKSAVNQCERSFSSWFNDLTFTRKLVIISMVFNMGIEGVKGFQKMIKSIESGDYESASSHMLNSHWAAQVGKRAVRLAATMKTGILKG